MYCTTFGDLVSLQQNKPYHEVRLWILGGVKLQEGAPPHLLLEYAAAVIASTKILPNAGILCVAGTLYYLL